MQVEQLVHPSVAAMRPYVAGTTPEQARQRYGLTSVVKLSSNENPWGSSPKAIAAMRSIDMLNRYIDDAYPAIRARLAEKYGLPLEQICVGSGSNEILAAIYRTFVQSGDEVIMPTPSFSLYRTDALMAGALPVEVPLVDGVIDLQAMIAAVTPRTKLLVICDPNNPTGTQLGKEELLAAVSSIPDHVLVVIDHAYVEYAEGGATHHDILAVRPHTVILRTASKVYGLAALRFGFGFASREIIELLSRTHLPFHVSTPAVVAMHAALDDQEFIAQSVGMNRQERQRVVDELKQHGLRVLPSQANFIAVHVPTTATDAYEALMRRGVIVRSGDGLRMPGALRVTIGLPEENTKFLSAMASYLGEI